jgi:sulfite exporter TauE/SafE
MFFSAIILGILGSLHCVGMCGPIAMYLANKSGGSNFNMFLYHVGRLSTYALLGALAGFGGILISLTGLPEIVSILAGVLLILGVLLGFATKHHLFSGHQTSLFYSKVKNLLPLERFQNSPIYFLLFGFLNGFLPCGLLYTAIVASLAAGTVSGSALYMILFGIGTSPALSVVFHFNTIFSSSFRTKALRWMPVFTLVLGILFVVRGLNLGIPYLSPKDAVCCKTLKECVK